MQTNIAVTEKNGNSLWCFVRVVPVQLCARWSGHVCGVAARPVTVAARCGGSVARRFSVMLLYTISILYTVDAVCANEYKLHKCIQVSQDRRSLMRGASLYFIFRTVYRICI